MIIKRNNIFLFFFVYWLSCTTPLQVADQTDPIERIDFSFLQEEGNIYIGALVKNPFNGNDLRYVSTAWFGLNNIDAVAADSIILGDVGAKGDILINDNLHAIKVKPGSLGPLSNKLAYTDTGIVHLKIVAHYEEGKTFELADSFSLGNIYPRFLSFDIPDTLTLPDSGLAKLITIHTEVEDPNGLDDIQWVGFRSKLLDENRMLNNGEYIYMDDTGDTISGDLTNGDGVFSRIIAFPYDAVKGKIEWRFRVQDWKGGFDDSTKVVIVKE
ncbi:MAG: hypothetical protein CMG75_09030 [Candidatus Marinimicrobia bacterium]|nr:hypothetical protein [Candidatus Neomarinimicrobiota bacterium]|tara:strand:+ start:1211 stop:2020 length:810 start_codon:yes stop_codon:yes gene_type:complete